MAFWTSGAVEPARQNRFRIVFTPSNFQLLEEEHKIALKNWQSYAPTEATLRGRTPEEKQKIKRGHLKLKPTAPSDYWWWAKSCTLPGFEIGQTEYQLLNTKFKYPGMLVWNDVTISIVDVGAKAESLMNMLSAAGYVCPGGISKDGCTSAGLSKGGFSKQGEFRIQQLNSDGRTVRSWLLRNWFIKSVRFGDLSYENDEFVTTEMVLGYDCAIIDAEDVLDDISSS